MAIAGVVVREGPGGGEVSRVGLEGGEGEKSSDGGGGEMMICNRYQSCLSVLEDVRDGKAYLVGRSVHILEGGYQHPECLDG